MKHDLKIDLYYVMTYFLFWNLKKKSFIATSRKVFWVFLNKEMRYKQNFGHIQGPSDVIYILVTSFLFEKKFPSVKFQKLLGLGKYFVFFSIKK